MKKQDTNTKKPLCTPLKIASEFVDGGGTLGYEIVGHDI